VAATAHCSDDVSAAAELLCSDNASPICLAMSPGTQGGPARDLSAACME
jgi:hypothetical protein